MIVLVAVLGAQAAGRWSGFVVHLAEHSRQPGRVVLGAMLVQAVMAGLAIAFGQTLAPEVTPDTRSLLLALALLVLGIGLFGRMAAPRAMPPRWSPLVAAVIGSGAIQLSDSTTLVIAAAAARSPLPWAALPGAMLGLAGAILPALLLGEREWRRLPLRAIRIGIGCAMILAGITIALSIRGLI